MTRKALMTAALALLVSPALAQVSRQGAPPRPRPSSTLELINQRIPEVTFTDAPFESVMDWVADFTQANVVVRWETLEFNGVDRDKPISMNVRNLRLSQVLWMIMNEAAGPDLKLAYRASGNMIVVSTAEDLGREMIVKVYDVSDLLINVPRFTNAARLDPAQALNQLGQGGTGGGGGGGGGGGSQLFETDQDEDEGDGEAAGQAQIQELIELITDTIEPDTWVQNGGLGTIHVFRGQLVVRNSALVHQRIGGYVSE